MKNKIHFENGEIYNLTCYCEYENIPLIIENAIEKKTLHKERK